jgi:hypothetical protein
MEHEHKQRLREQFPDLVALIRQRVEPLLV